MAKCSHDWTFEFERNPKTGRETEIATCKVCRWRRLATMVRKALSLRSPYPQAKKTDYGQGNQKTAFRLSLPRNNRRCIG